MAGEMSQYTSIDDTPCTLRTMSLVTVCALVILSTIPATVQAMHTKSFSQLQDAAGNFVHATPAMHFTDQAPAILGCTADHSTLHLTSGVKGRLGPNVCALQTDRW